MTVKWKPLYHWDTKNIPSSVRGQVQRLATKCELERIVNDIKQPHQIFLTKPNTSHSYNLRSKPGSVAIPKSGMQRHTNLFIARAARLLLLWSVYLYLLLLEIHLIVFIVYVFSLSLCKSIVYNFKDGYIVYYYAVCCSDDLPLHTMNLTLSNSFSCRNFFNYEIKDKDAN